MKTWRHGDAEERRMPCGDAAENGATLQMQTKERGGLLAAARS